MLLADVRPLEMAQALAYLGQTDRAFEWLDSALPAAMFELQTSYPNPLFQPLRGDPRWRLLLERIERTPEQLAKTDFSLDGARERLGLPGAP